MREWSAEIRERLAGLRLSPSREAEIVEELSQHLAQRCDELVAGGSSEDEARRIALAELNGPITLAEYMQPLQQARVAPPIPVGSPSAMFSGVRDDLRLAVRVLRATPVVTAATILSLTLGIGANTAIFSIADSLLLRPLPVERPQQLAVVLAQPPGAAAGLSAWSNPVWEQIRDRQHELFETAFAYSARVSRFNLATSGQADLVDGIWVSGDYFNGLGVAPLLGRTLNPSDDQRGGGANGPVAVISHGLWLRRYRGTADVVGRSVTIDRVPFTIVGVMPARFFGADVGTSFDVAVPLSTEPLMRGRDSYLDRPTTSWLAIMARLNDGQEPSQAQSALEALLPHIREVTMPQGLPPASQARYLTAPVTVESAAIGTSSMRTTYRRPLLILLAVVALVLLIACANIANLQTTRVVARRHEFSVRLAMGASRWRLARQLIVESLALAIVGAVLGLWLAHWMSGFLIRQLTTHANTVFLNVPVDGRVVGFTAALAVASAILFGTLPAWFSFRSEPIGAIRAHGRSAMGGRQRGSSAALVAAQVALSLLLLITAGLLIRTFASILNRDLGFDREAVLVTQLDLRATTVAPAARTAFYQELAEAAAALPGVAGAAVSDITPVSGSIVDAIIEVENGPPSTDVKNVAFQNVITSSWFATYGTRVVSGRDFDRRDQPGAVPVVIVNETFARRFVPQGSPIGRRIRKGVPGRQGPWLEIVGVVADAAYRSVREPLPPTLYMPLSQVKEPPPTMRLSVRTAAAPPTRLANTVAAAISRIDPNVVTTSTSLEQQVNAVLVQERILAMLSGFFGMLAVVLAGVGLYGTSWYGVTRRRRELGIRLALGATPATLRRLVLSRAALLVAAGAVAGVAGSIWTSKFLTALLYGVEPFDPSIIAFAVGAVAVVALMAAWVPATRASRIQPAEVLRDS
jgi:putative ABC transport system permease protein